MNQKGFSLIEILVAATILAFLVISVTTISNNSLTTKEKVVEDDKEFLQVETAMSRILRDLSHLYSPLYFSQKWKKPTDKNSTNDDLTESAFERYRENRNFDGASKEFLPIPIFKAQDGAYEFFTTSHRRKYENAKESHFTWIRYLVESNEYEGEVEERKGLNKITRYSFPTNPYSSRTIDFSLVKGFTLLEHVESFKLEFWDPKSKNFVDSLGQVKDGKNLLRAIRVSITWVDPVGAKIEFEKIIRPIWPYFDAETKDAPKKEGAH